MLMLLLILLFVPLICLGALILIPTVAYRESLPEAKRGKEHNTICKSTCLILLGVVLLPITIIFCLLFLGFTIINCSMSLFCGKKDVNNQNDNNYRGSSRDYYDRFFRQRAQVDRNYDNERASYSGDSDDESIPSQNRSIVVTID